MAKEKENSAESRCSIESRTY